VTTFEASAHLVTRGAGMETSTQPRSNPAEWHGLRVRMIFSAAAICAVGLVAWMIVLGFTLPGRYEVNRWEPTWLGFDAILFLGFASTAWTIRKHRASAMLFATITGTLLAADAWFDVLTASGHGEVLSVGTAVFVEMPLAAWLFYTAVRVFNQAIASACETEATTRTAGYSDELSASSHPPDTRGNA
jgi:hypothetical protein